MGGSPSIRCNIDVLSLELVRATLYQMTMTLNAKT